MNTKKTKMVPTYHAAAVVLAVLAGCSVAEPYQRPEMVVPSAWLSPVLVAEPGAVPALVALVTEPDAEWWRGFGSPALDGLMRQAEVANSDLAAAIARVRQADAQARIVGASLLPSLDGGASINRQLKPSLSSGGDKSTPTTASAETVYGVNLSASYELDFWGKNDAAAESALAASRASRFDRQTIALTVQAGVATTYFNIIGQQDRLAVARANLANAEQFLAAIRDRLRFGTATDLDVAQQESVVAGLRAVLPVLERTLRQGVNTLALLVGGLPEQVGVATGTLTGITLTGVTLPLPSPGLPSELLARRPDIQFAEAQLVAANADLAAAKAALFPSIKLTAEMGFQSLALTTLLHGGGLLYSMAAGITQPIFHGEALMGAQELKEARYDELVQGYRKAVLSAFSDVENALNAAGKTAEEETAQRVVVNTARRANDISQAQFRAGLVDITTMLNTQKTLFQAEDALVQSRLGHIQGVVGLFKALGGGFGG
ncbi:MAG: efflux transporter outer membrane subunit, partial [Rhodospirillaceae bacterium]